MKTTDGFTASLSREQCLEKARAARRRDSDCVSDKSADTGGVYPGPDKRPSSTMRKNTPMRAIRAYCLDCVCGSYHEVELCPAEECPLHPFRFGKRPATIRRRQEEQVAS